jgi:hypothetical protein
MKQQRSKLMPAASATAAVLMLLIQPLRADVREQAKDVGGTTVHYKIVLPNG